MGFLIEIKGPVALVSFPNLEEDGRSLSAEISALLSEPERLIAFDFGALDKIDFHLLRELEPAVKALRGAGRSYAVCCKDPAIQAVLETAGLLAGADLFASAGEFLRFTARRTGTLKIPHSSRKRSVWSGLLHVRYDFHTLGLGVIVFLLLMGGLQNLFLSFHVKRLSERVEQLAFLAQSAEPESAPASIPSSVSGEKKASVRPELLSALQGYNEASRSLRRNAQSFIDAQRSFYRQSARFASSLEELGWSADPGVDILEQRSLPSGELARIEIARKLDAGRSLKWDADIRSGIRAIP